MNVLVAKNLSAHIAGKALIENINFELMANERLVIIGPNGAGKTVLLKALLDLLPHSDEQRQPVADRFYEGGLCVRYRSASRY
jgi:ABC-type cobalamin/Fe3+-siderophores transport system ATPase subunit